MRETHRQTNKRKSHFPFQEKQVNKKWICNYFSLFSLKYPTHRKSSKYKLRKLTEYKFMPVILFYNGRFLRKSMTISKTLGEGKIHERTDRKAFSIILSLGKNAQTFFVKLESLLVLIAMSIYVKFVMQLMPNGSQRVLIIMGRCNLEMERGIQRNG
jgi:hypothetical protein